MQFGKRPPPAAADTELERILADRRSIEAVDPRPARDPFDDENRLAFARGLRNIFILYAIVAAFLWWVL
jgi:hypothetical protein